MQDLQPLLVDDTGRHRRLFTFFNNSLLANLDVDSTNLTTSDDLIYLGLHLLDLLIDLHGLVRHRL